MVKEKNHQLNKTKIIKGFRTDHIASLAYPNNVKSPIKVGFKTPNEILERKCLERHVWSQLLCSLTNYL